MGLRIIYGKPGSGKSEYCFSEISKLVEKEKKIFIITPEQFSFTAEKKLMDCLQTKAVMNAEVITLSRMAYRVISEVGGNKNNLSKCGKAMLVYSILNKYKKELKFLGKSDENIDLSITAITEFKKHGVTVDNLKEEALKTEDEYLKSKLQDMTLIYEKFEEKIINNYIDETDLLTILANNLEKTDFIKDSIIYIDEFAGFTHQEYQVLKELIKQAKQVNITICIDDLNLNTNPDKDIYYSNKITLSKLLNLAKENELKLEAPVFLDEQYRFKTDELKFLSDNIYNKKTTKYEKNVENIELFLAKNEYSEVEEVAKKISKLVRNQKLRYRDISIITKNIDNYSSLVKAIFNKYEIPVFIDEKRDLNQNIIVQYVLSILEVLNRNFSQEAVFSYIKLGFLDIEDDEIFKLENYCIKWGIKQSKWKKDFIYELNDENKKQEIERLNELRKQIIEPLLYLQEEIKKEKTAENITKAIYECQNLSSNDTLFFSLSYLTLYLAILFSNLKALLSLKNKVTIMTIAKIITICTNAIINLLSIIITSFPFYSNLVLVSIGISFGLIFILTIYFAVKKLVIQIIPNIPKLITHCHLLFSILFTKYIV